MESPRAVADDLRRFCLEQAKLCVLEDSRQALLIMADRYAAAAQAIEGRSGFARTAPTRRFFAVEWLSGQSSAEDVGMRLMRFDSELTL